MRQENQFYLAQKVLQGFIIGLIFYTFKPIYNNGIKEQLGISDKFVLLGVASEWTNRKGLSDFIELSSRLQGDETIVLIGYIDSRVKLPSNVIHINETHNAKKLAEYYSMADIFLNLSKEESFGKVTAEALACGTPVITNNLTANKEFDWGKLWYCFK